MDVSSVFGSFRFCCCEHALSVSWKRTLFSVFKFGQHLVQIIAL